MLYDANVWVALLIAQHVHNERARQHFDALAAGQYALLTQSVRISVSRILTLRSLHTSCSIEPITNAAAFDYLARITQSPKVRNLLEPAEIFVTWRDLAAHPHSAPNRWMDAYLCAIARHAGVPIVTLDQGMLHYAQYGVDVRVL
jgi:toxin-antitoxin system PIN domain toxin